MLYNLQDTSLIKRLIFLDIDGVMYQGKRHDQRYQQFKRDGDAQAYKSDPRLQNLSPQEQCEIKRYTLYSCLGFDANAIKNLKELCAEEGTYIVLSSKWRSGTLFASHLLFKLHGIPAEKFIGFTPIIYHQKRGYEIYAFLCTHKINPQHLLILDDNTFDICDYFPHNFLHCRQLFADETSYSVAAKILAQPFILDTSPVLQTMASLDAKLNCLHLTTLNMVAYTLQERTSCSLVWRSLCAALQTCRQLKVLQLQGFQNVLCFIPTLVEALENSKCVLTHLDLANSVIDGLLKLLSYITAQQQAFELRLYSRDLSVDGIASLRDWVGEPDSNADFSALKRHRTQLNANKALQFIQKVKQRSYFFSDDFSVLECDSTACTSPQTH